MLLISCLWKKRDPSQAGKLSERFLSVKKWFFQTGKDFDKISHIFRQIQLFPVADIEAAPLFDSLNGVNTAARIQLRRHFYIVDGTNHNGTQAMAVRFPTSMLDVSIKISG